MVSSVVQLAAPNCSGIVEHPLRSLRWEEWVEQGMTEALTLTKAANERKCFANRSPGIGSKLLTLLAPTASLRSL